MGSEARTGFDSPFSLLQISKQAFPNINRVTSLLYSKSPCAPISLGIIAQVPAMAGKAPQPYSSVSYQPSFDFSIPAMLASCYSSTHQLCFHLRAIAHAAFWNVLHPESLFHFTLVFSQILLSQRGLLSSPWLRQDHPPPTSITF